MSKKPFKLIISIISLAVIAGLLTIKINRHRPTADVDEDLPIPEPIIEQVNLINTGSSELPDPDGWLLWFKIGCPVEDQPCDWSTAVRYQFKDASEEDPYQPAHMLTAEGGGLGRELGEPENKFLAFEDEVEFVMYLDGTPQTSDEHTIFAAFLNPDTLERGEETEYTYKVGQQPTINPPINL